MVPALRVLVLSAAGVAASGRIVSAAGTSGALAPATCAERLLTVDADSEGESLVQISTEARKSISDPHDSHTMKTLARRLAKSVARSSSSALREGMQTPRSCHLRSCRCGLKSFKRHVPYKVFPGGKTGCLNSTEPYYFKVVRGDCDKLLVAFQGGGLCWDSLSYQQGTCYKVPTEEGMNGILDTSNPKNPYRKYTVVLALYCSGDGFTGSACRAWGTDGEKRVNVRGYENMKAVLDWTSRQHLKPKKLVVAGWSAGGLATVWWGQDVLRRFLGKHTTAVVLSDSFLGGTYPPPFQATSQGLLFEAWGSCTTGLLQGPVKQACLSKQLTFAQMVQAGLKAFPAVQFGSVNSKTDLIQILFLRLIALTQQNAVESQLTPFQYYQSVNEQLQTFSKEPNFYSYLINGQEHIVLPTPFFYTATPLGFDGSLGGEPKLVDWASKFPCSATNANRSVCMGPHVPMQPWPAPPIMNPVYCDASLP